MVSGLEKHLPLFILPNFRSSQAGERSFVPAFFARKIELFTSLPQVQATQMYGDCSYQADHLDHH